MKQILFFFLTAFLSASSFGEFRTWTREDGKTASLELSEVKGAAGAKVGVFQMRNGRSVEIPASSLSDDDARLIEQWANKPDLVAAKKSIFDEFLEGNLEKFDGRSLKRYRPEAEQMPTQYYLFYYTASWCPPCQKFTPSLVKFYDEARPKHPEFEIVLITSDQDDRAMNAYAEEKGMNWPHLKRTKVERFKKEFPHPGGGIPNLVLTDLDGKILKTSYVNGEYDGPTSVMQHLEGLLKVANSGLGFDRIPKL